MAYNVKQISSILNDVISDLSGQNAAISTIDTSDLVSMGKAISSAQLLDGWFGALCNRLAKTVYFVRVYDPARARSILRDEHEYGAFVQKVYFTVPDVVDNSEYLLPDPSTGKYTQASPYDVDETVAVAAKIFDEQGTFAIEIVRPVDQIRSAFLSESEMMRFIDGIYLAIDNKMKLAEEGLISAAVATAMAYDIENGKARNLLSEYNTTFGDSLSVAAAQTDPDFLKWAAMEIKNTIDNMQAMSVNYNAGGYLTFTDRDNLVVEILSRFGATFDTFLGADTFHRELVELPRYESVPRWQYSPDDVSQGFEDVSSIKVKNDALTGGAGADANIVTQSGIIAFVHDIEHVAAYFGHRRSWEKYNERSDVYIHGETARKGYAVDPNANGIVFYIA